METETEQTESTATTDVAATNNQIELSVVQGESSGLFTFSETKLNLAEDTTFEQWKEILKTIKWVRKKAAIGIADCIEFGVKKWGRESVDQALEQLELEATLVKAAIAINSIPLELRFDNLEADHYVELARAQLPKRQAIRWARIASEQHLTASQLRFSIVEGEVVDRAVSKQLQTGVYTVHGIRQSFDIWVRRVGGIEGVKKMDLDHQMEIMEELAAICEFGIALNDHLEELQKQAQ